MFITDQNFSELTDEQVEEKIQKLSKIVFSRNMQLSRQAKPILVALYEEQNARSAAKFQEHLNKSGIDVSEIINIV